MFKINYFDLVKIILDRKVIIPIIIIIIGIIVYFILSKLIKKILLFKINGVRINKRRQKTTVSVIDNILKYFITLVCLMMILDIYGIDTKSLLASLGIISLVAGLALQDLLKDFIAGMAILFEDQYAVGDVVTIDNFKGTVTYLGIKSTRLTAYTGEVLIVSNRNINRVVNHTLEDNLSLMDIPVAYDSNIDEVRNVLNGICEVINSDESMDISTPAQVCGIESLDDSAVIIRIIFGAKYNNKYAYERKIREMVKESFAKNDIEIPFNQVVIHNGK